MAFNENNDIQSVKERLNIVDIINDYVKLRRSGRNYTGLCPFHDEKTPSFTVSPERQTYHCFGCGRGGDVFSFLMEMEGLDFRSCLEHLASRVGVELTNNSASRKSEKKATSDLYEVMSLASNFFSEKLKASEGVVGRGYIQRRNLTVQDAERFGLGWSPASWDGLLRYLRDNGVPDKVSLESGLILQGQNGNLHDRFRGRLMFPIKDIMGRVIAFGGRLVDGEGPKYINSPEGSIYSKRRNLYLLNQAKTAIHEKKRCILVEGYMDALRLHLCGFSESVASLGTALTEEQAKLIKRFADCCYICYDNDSAGQDATLRSMYLLQKSGLAVQVISLPSGKDPDELLTAQNLDSDSRSGRELFETAINEARPLILHHLEAAKDKLSSPLTRQAGYASLMSGLVQLNKMDISPYVGQLSEVLGLPPDIFWRELVKCTSQGRSSYKSFPKKTALQSQAELGVAKRARTREALELALISLLWENNSINCPYDHEAKREILSLFNPGDRQDIAIYIMLEVKENLYSRWRSLGETLPFEMIAKGDAERERLCDIGDDAYDDSSASEGVDTVDLFKSICSELRRLRDLEQKDSQQLATCANA